MQSKVEQMRADVLNSGLQGLPAQGLLPLQHQSATPQMGQIAQHGAIRQKFLGRGVSQAQWRSNMTLPLHTQMGANTQTMSGQSNIEGSMIRKEGCSIPFFNANLQPAPPLPPENILTEHDRQLQMAYEQWLTTQNTVLSNQLQYYETEVGKLRKTKKSLNSKQRALRKAGNELTEQDANELAKVSSEQSIVQKQLESARKQARQHGLLIQDYKTKQQSKVTSQMISPLSNHPSSSPAQIAPQSPLMSQSPSSQLIMQPAQSPLSNPLLQPNRRASSNGNGGTTNWAIAQGAIKIRALKTVKQ